MKIRLAQEQDLEAILEISNWAAMNTPANFAIEPESIESWRQNFEETSRMFPWMVATEEEVVIGFAKSSPWKGRCAYTWAAEVTVYIHPDHHGQRHGTTLYTRLIEILKAQGYRTLLGGITQPNEASVRLHESMGFQKVSHFERIGWKFDQWHDVGYWQLMLGESEKPPEPIKPVAQVSDIECRL
ncbi:MAG: GNAT family N-acetyltransferase [Planctomycetota bacterium]|nr:GNAT family N-acetyltransferase [Planctomycetota bacterium]